MIKVNKDLQAVPSRLMQNVAFEQTRNAIATQNGNLYTTNYNHSTVKEALALLYHNKCAYCESSITKGAYLQVEHYRPKAKIDVKDLPFGQSHRGYYWLGNEWSNLLFSCQKCNQQGAKGNRFPIKGIRVLTHPHDPSHYSILHQSMLDEIPLLLNPEIVDPLDHLYLDHEGVLYGKSEFGLVSINLYNLNRQILIFERLKIIKDFVLHIKEQLDEFEHPTNPISQECFQRQINLIFKRIFAKQKPEVEYSFVYINIALNFDSMILPHLESKYRAEIKTAFQTFIYSNLP